MLEDRIAMPSHITNSAVCQNLRFLRRTAALAALTLMMAAIGGTAAAPATPTPQASLANTTDAAGVAFFEQKIRPLLAEHCYACHSASAGKVKGNLLLDTRAGTLRGGDSGQPAVVPGKPEESLLIRVVRHQEDGLEMPPKKPRLPDAAVADLITWIRNGAPDPRDGTTVDVKRADRSWWSLQPIRPIDPADHSIDSLIDAKLAEAKLTRNPPADARTLIRRLSYDLIGLPPTHAEVDAFVREHARDPQAATEALVDRLLASPQYGERWGRHWLDVVRFGESRGFERNVILDDLWPFRDYVIRSINQDKPFDRFIIEHLAGDVIGKDNPEVEVGTAFLVAGPYDDVGNQDAVAQKQIRAATLDDTITATAGAFLGLTINCARCHHHKFDPIPTEDYYRLRAAFEGVQHASRTIASPQQRKELEQVEAPLRQQLAALSAEREAIEKTVTDDVRKEIARRKPTRPKVDPQYTRESFEPVDAKYVKFVIHATTQARQNGLRDGRGGRGGRLTEFEVWTAAEPSQNVALASAGAKADGARGMTAEDFPEAYGPQLCIDGQRGEQWFIGDPSELTITLPSVRRISAIGFSNAKGDRVEDKSQGATPCEYDVLVSVDGKAWKRVAGDDGREPFTPQHAQAAARQAVVRPETDRRLAELQKQIAPLQARLSAPNRLPQVWAGTFTQPRERTFVHKGGDPTKPGEAVSPAGLSVLGGALPPFELKPDAPESERRLALARWMVDPRNPLTPRVLANRVWHYHFGTGLVDTPSDFGFLGGKPSHPELLDYLAGRLTAHGWRLKPLHREIVLSKTYLQSSTYRADAAGVDRDARLLWRFPPRRLSAEELRDTMLHVAGVLRLDPAGGPGFRLYKFTQNNVCTYIPLDRHGPDTYRRSVYHQNARASVVDVLSDFDLPDSALATPRRANTTTPLQALTLMNHTFSMDMAKALADRARREGGENDEAAVRHVFAVAFQRPPAADEVQAALPLIKAHGLPAFCRAVLNANELIYVD
jgi:mono/diheme cytochrome c family protein